jgi:hypothetical protein
MTQDVEIEHRVIVRVDRCPMPTLELSYPLFEPFAWKNAQHVNASPPRKWLWNESHIFVEIIWKVLRC